MLVSFLCPSRGRPASLKRSVESLRKHAKDEACFEVMVYLDENDPERDNYEDFPQARFTVGPQTEYSKLHEISRFLLRQSSAPWLFVWNDDALMQTPEWDVILQSCDLNQVLCPRTNHPDWDKLNVFPIVPRTWVDIAGWPQNAAVDTWWAVISMALKRVGYPAISVLHDRSDLTGNHQDATRAGNNYDPKTFFNLNTYFHMGVAAGRIYESLYAGRERAAKL